MPHSASQATSAAAASALPPAMPPATGMSLVMCSATSGLRPTWRASAIAAAAARLDGSCGTSSTGTPVPALTLTARPSESVAVTSSYSDDGVEDGGQVVEAVAAQRADRRGEG